MKRFDLRSAMTGTTAAATTMIVSRQASGGVGVIGIVA